MRHRIAPVGRTTQFVFAIAQATNFHLPSGEFSFAHNAKTLVVE
jgi:hypothetical protein